MPRWLGALLLAGLILLFLVANRGAYKGYFQDDDLDNLSWTRHPPLKEFAAGIVTPQFSPHNFRPVGHLYYWILGRTARLNFTPYVAVLHTVHLINVLLVWLVARKLGAHWAAASAAALFFAFHMAAFDAYWRPMYVFDVFCALFCLLALLAYVHGRVVLSLVAFWLAYKSKELAVMLPAVLLLYECWLGERRWRRLIPFFAISASFGLQALFTNRGLDNAYTLRFTPIAFWTCLQYYSSKLLLAPYAGFVILILPFFVRDWRLKFGIVSAGLLLTPLLFLPGRLYSVYLYVPLAVLAIGLSALAGRLKPVYVALFFAVWIPVNYKVLIANRKAALTIAHENQAFVAESAAYFHKVPETRTVVYEGAPAGMQRWGVEATFRLTSFQPNIDVVWINDKNAPEALQREAMAVLSWFAPKQKLFAATRGPGERDRQYIQMNLEAPIWQLQDGWFSLEHDFRWIRPRAEARLYRPENARQFELIANLSKLQLDENGPPLVQVLLDGQALAPRRFSKVGWEKAGWDLPPAQPGLVRVEIRVTPEFRPKNGDPRTLGIAIVAFGFPRDGGA